MSATWTCICGKSFDVDEWRQGQLVKCPACEFVLGEALPAHFEPPTTFQVEPTPRTLLANPEVAVQSAEPRVRAMASAIDELGEPDIRVKGRFRLSVTLLYLLFGIAACNVAVIWYSLGLPYSTDGNDVAQVQIKALTRTCEAYHVKHGRYPVTLNEFLQKDEHGIIWIDDVQKLFDPWGRPWQYDPKGPNHDGVRPDIWVVTRDGMTIGNWPKALEEEKRPWPAR